MAQKGSGPIVGKDTSFPFQTAIACWIDLLGYGQMIAAASFNPLHPKAARAKQRLRAFHQVIAFHSARSFPTLVLNDGAVAYRDLSYRSASVTYDFLTRCWTLFNAIKDAERQMMYPGARMVVAAGFRLKGRRSGIDATAAHFESIVTRLSEGKTSVREAIQEARHIRPSFDVVPQLQANFAFTKAYVAEQSGTAGGLGGSQCFVDLVLFDDTNPDGFQFGEHVYWQNEKLRLRGIFAPLLSLERHPTSTPAPRGVRDALAVAQQLAGDKDILRALRSA